MDRVRFGLLGFGLHAGNRLVPAFRQSQAAALTGFWRRDAAKAAADAAKHGLHAFASAEELCASPDVDAVFIVSPDALHLEDARLAFAAGKAVLCEKPLALSTADAEAMQRAAEAAGVVFGVAHNFRWNASAQRLRERVLAGDVGAVRTVHAEFNYLAQHSPRKWITDPTLAAGGPIGDVGVHCIDTLRYILGHDSGGVQGAEVQSVVTLATQDELSGAVEASAQLQFMMSGEVLASVSVSARAAYRTVVEIVGNDGVLFAENALTVDRPVEVVLRRRGEHVETQSYSNADAYTRMIDNFAGAVRGTEEFLAPGSEGVRNQRILDAAYRSWHSGNRERC